MGFWNQDKSDYQIKVKQGKRSRWRWQLIGADGNAVALPPIRDSHPTREKALEACGVFIRGMGADTDDFDLIE